jgi:MFS family permease
MQVNAQNIESFKTKATALLMNLSDEPLVAFYAILPFILTKELHINAFELSFFLMLRPILSSFSFFWGVGLNYSKNPNLLKNNLLAWIIARIPFLFFPLINNFYYFLFASAVYQLFHKAGLPAWNEIIKRNITDKNERHKLFSTFSIYVFIESILLGLFIGKFLDKSASNWKLIFFFAAMLSLSSIFLQMRIKVPKNNEQTNVRENFFTPFKDIFEILKKDKDFTNFQIVFMIGGFALMLITPALYIFASEELQLSHSDMTSARLILMGIGFSLTSYIWKKFIAKRSINNLAIWMIFIFGIYNFFLLLSQYNLIFFYIAFFFYGIAQAGSTLLWSFSSISFSKNQNSILYTSTNLLFLLLRGLIAPFLGSLLCYFFGAKYVLCLGLIIMFFGTVIAYRLSRKNQFSIDKKSVFHEGDILT